MPRPKSDLTDNCKYVGIKLTPSQLAKWHEIGAQQWLRKYLYQLIEQDWQKKQKAKS